MDTHFDGDAFISYAHLDNVELVEGRKGWVANLHRALEVRVGQLLGKAPHIWRDPKLPGNDLFADTLVDRLKRVAVLVTVVSPRYVKSEWTLRELDEFWRAAEEQGGIRVGNKARVFKVLKTPVPLDRTPPELRALLGYEFFKVDPETGKVRELDDVFGPDAQRDFWLRLDDLAHDIVRPARGARGPTPSRRRRQNGAAPAAPAPESGQTSISPTRRATCATSARPSSATCGSRATRCCPTARCRYVGRRGEGGHSRRPRAAAACRFTWSAATTASCPRAARSRSSRSSTSSRSSGPPKAASRASSGSPTASRSTTSGSSGSIDAAPDRSAHPRRRRSARDLLEDLRTTMQDWLEEGGCARRTRPAAPAPTGRRGGAASST